MSVPTSSIGLSNIFYEANQITPSGLGVTASMNELSRYSYFEGPGGSNVISINSWGLTSAGGSNRIYRTPFVSPTNPYNFSYYSGLDYFYDDSGATSTSFYDAAMNYDNSCPPPITPPDPPDVFDFNIQLELYDNSLTYSYNNYGTLILQGTTGYKTMIPRPATVPLINKYYWILTIQTTPGYPGVQGNRHVTLKCNGSNLVNFVTINNGANVFTSNTYGTASITGITSATDPYSSITPYTGSYWDLLIN